MIMNMHRPVASSRLHPPSHVTDPADHEYDRSEKKILYVVHCGPSWLRAHMKFSAGILKEKSPLPRVAYCHFTTVTVCAHQPFT